MNKKYETAGNITIGAALCIYEDGIALIVTDGKYVQIEKEDKIKGN